MYELSLAISVITFLVVMVFVAQRPSFNVLSPLSVYCVFHFLIFVLRPILAYTQNFDHIYLAYDFQPSVADKITVIYASNLGFVTFVLFSLLFGDVPMTFRRDRVDALEQRRLTQVFVWVWAICGPLALYSALRSTQSFFGGEYVQGMILDRGTGAFINTSSNGYLTDAQFMLVTMCAILAWAGRFRLLALTPLALFVVYRSMTGSRIMFVYALAIALLFFVYEKRISRPSWRVLLFALLPVILFRMVGDDRGASVRQVLGTEAKEQVLTGDVRTKERPLESMDYANMEFFEYLVYVVPQRSGTYDYFLDNFQVLTEPIPRVLWSGKPIGEPFRRIFLFNYGYPIGMTKSLPGEGWYALGWVGVVVWCGFWGGLPRLDLSQVRRRAADHAPGRGLLRLHAFAHLVLPRRHVDYLRQATRHVHGADRGVVAAGAVAVGADRHRTARVLAGTGAWKGAGRGCRRSGRSFATGGACGMAAARGSPAA